MGPRDSLSHPEYRDYSRRAAGAPRADASLPGGPGRASRCQGLPVISIPRSDLHLPPEHLPRLSPSSAPSRLPVASRSRPVLVRFRDRFASPAVRTPFSRFRGVSQPYASRLRPPTLPSPHRAPDSSLPGRRLCLGLPGRPGLRGAGSGRVSPPGEGLALARPRVPSKLTQLRRPSLPAASAPPSCSQGPWRQACRSWPGSKAVARLRVTGAGAGLVVRPGVCAGCGEQESRRQWCEAVAVGRAGSEKRGFTVGFITCDTSWKGWPCGRRPARGGGEGAALSRHAV